MNHHFSRLSIIIVVLWFLSNVLAQDTPTPEQIRVLLFPDDNCETICWMGIIPDESTAADVEAMFGVLEEQLLYWEPHGLNTTLDPETDYIVDGYYNLKWRYYSGGEHQQTASFIDIKNSTVNLIFLFANERITLEQVLDRLGEPDDVQFDIGQSVFYIILNYIDELIRVRLTIPRGCTMSNIGQETEMEAIKYYSYESAMELIETEYGLQPRLLAYHTSDLDRQVSLEIFQSWLDGEVDMSCEEAWELLPEPEITSTPTPQPIQSIFNYDTCAPPCWMGLISGESTAIDVEDMLEQNQDLIDPEHVSMSLARLESGEFAIDPDTGEVIRATYNFDVAVPYFDTMGTTSVVLIRERSVYEIGIHAHSRISLDEVFDNLGEPSIVRLDVFGTAAPRIRFIYPDLSIRVSIRTDKDSQECHLNTLREDMVVTTIIYLSPSAIHGEFGLFDYLSDNERDVPLELWQSWLDGEVDMSCEEAWELLPEPEITPAVEMTIEPESTKESK